MIRKQVQPGDDRESQLRQGAEHYQVTHRYVSTSKRFRTMLKRTKRERLSRIPHMRGRLASSAAGGRLGWRCGTIARDA